MLYKQPFTICGRMAKSVLSHLVVGRACEDQ